MSSLSDIQQITFMRLTLSQFQSAWRRGRIIQWLCMVFAWLLLGGGAFLLIKNPLGSSDTLLLDVRDTLTSIALNIVFILLLPLVLLICAVMFVPSKSRWLGSQTLRAAVLAGESKQIPAAFDQPPPLTGAELPRDTKPFLRLKLFPPTSNLVLLLYFVMGLSLITLIVLEVGLWQFESGLTGLNNVLQIVAFVLAIGRISAIGGGPNIIADGWGTLLPARRPKLLAVDDWGIRWRARGWQRREYTLAWQDVVSFCVYRLSTGTSSKVTYIYLIMSNDVSFGWMLSPRRNRTVSATSELLCRLVTTHTRRPLLDMTRAVETVDMWTTRATSFNEGSAAHGLQQKLRARMEEIEEIRRQTIQQASAAGKSERDVASSIVAGWKMADEMAPLHQATLQEISPSASPVRPIRLRGRFYWLNVLLMLLVAVSICGLWGLNDYQLSAYYRALPALIAAETPLFSDPLTDRDYAWDIQTPTATDSTLAQYAHGGYAITGGPTGFTNEETMDAQYVDVAIAVTARQIGSSDSDGVGLVARSLDSGMSQTDEIIFLVSPSGSGWSLYHYQPGHSNPDDNWNYLDGGGSDAIHEGDNASNRLLLVLRGAEYLCYINGQFVARDVDSTVTPSSPKFGYPGLFVNDDTTTGVFNDFAVYDLPPPYQPLLHG